MNLLCILIIIWAAAAIIRKVSSASHEREAERERERIREEQQIIRLEQIRAREAEKARLAWQKRQDAINRQAQAERERLRKEQERQAKEQERQATQLARHEEMIARNTQILKQAAADIDFQNERIAELDAQLDYLMMKQAATVPGSKEHERLQSKIVSLHNQIHTAESKLSRAQFNREQAQRKLA